MALRRLCSRMYNNELTLIEASAFSQMSELEDLYVSRSYTFLGSATSRGDQWPTGGIALVANVSLPFQVGYERPLPVGH